MRIIEDNLVLLTRLASLQDAEFDSDFRNLYIAVHLQQMCVEAVVELGDFRTFIADMRTVVALHSGS